MSSERPAPPGDLDRSLRDLAMPPPPPMGGALADELARLAPVPTRRPMRDLGRVAGVSLVYAAVLLALAHLRRDLDGLPIGWVVGVAAAWFASFTSLLWLAIVPRRGAVMPRWRAAGAAAIAASVLFVVGGLVLHEHTPHSVELGLPRLVDGYRCLGYGMATALVPVVLGALVLRGAVPVGSRWLAAGLGAAGGSLGGLILHLHCPISDGWHVGLVHGGVVVISAVLAAALAPGRLER